jgi:hypothetical protein
MQPYTSAIGRICFAEKMLASETYTGVAFWLHEAEQQWFLGLYSPQWFLARDPGVLPELVTKLLTRQRKITSNSGLSLELIKEFFLDDWTDIVANPFLRSVIISRAKSLTSHSAHCPIVNDPPITKRQFLTGTAPRLDRVSNISFNGIEFGLGTAKGVIRFVDNLWCLDFHEFLLVTNGDGTDFSDDERELIKLICETLECAAFEPFGPRIM